MTKVPETCCILPTNLCSQWSLQTN